jgi:Lon protease-like protein
MRKKLPQSPNLEHLKSQAKDLLHAFRAKQADALQRFRDALPAVRGLDDQRLAAMDLKLHDAQSVIAREYGFPSFAELRKHVGTTMPAAETLRALLEPLHAPLPDEVMRILLAAASEERTGAPALVSPVPLLPLRNAVLAVGAVAPLSIGRKSSTAGVEAALGGGGLLGVFSQRDETNEAPIETELHPVGCLARLLGAVPHGAGLWIVVRAVTWIKLEAIEHHEPYVLARVSHFTVQDQPSAVVKQLEQALRQRLRMFAAKLPAPEYILRQTDRMNALELADIAIANLRCSVEEKARYAEEPSLRARLEYVLALLDRAA